MIKCRVQLSASNVHHEAPFSNFLGLKKKKKTFHFALRSTMYLLSIYISSHRAHINSTYFAEWIFISQDLFPVPS